MKASEFGRPCLTNTHLAFGSKGDARSEPSLTGTRYPERAQCHRVASHTPRRSIASFLGMYSTSLCRSISAIAFAAALSTRASANSSKSLLVTSILRLVALNSTPRRSYDKKNAVTRTGDSVKFCIIYLIGKFYQFYPTYFKFYPTFT